MGTERRRSLTELAQYASRSEATDLSVSDMAELDELRESNALPSASPLPYLDEQARQVLRDRFARWADLDDSGLADWDLEFFRSATHMAESWDPAPENDYVVATHRYDHAVVVIDSFGLCMFEDEALTDSAGRESGGVLGSLLAAESPHAHIALIRALRKLDS